MKCDIRTKRHRFDINMDREKNYKVLQILVKDGIPKREAMTSTLDLLPMISSSEHFGGFFTGKKINPDCIDASEVRGWIDECLQYHGGPCWHMDDAQLDEVRGYLRVIDINKNCLTFLPKKASQYTTLSYVWGQGRGEFKTTKRNHPEISKPGGLTAHIGNLSLVIQDAIAFTKSIGEKYLWVD